MWSYIIGAYKGFDILFNIATTLVKIAPSFLASLKVEYPAPLDFFDLDGFDILI